MSGIIPDSILSVNIENLDPEGGDQYYCLVSFHDKVVVTGVKLIVNGEARGYTSDSVDWDRTWVLGAVKGRKTPGGEEPWYEDLVPFFGDNEKPTVLCGQGDFVSQTATPAEKYEWYVNGDPYDGNVAQMDPNEYLMLYAFADGGDFEAYNPEFSKATIVISYTGASPNL